MSRVFTDESLMTWEVYATGGDFGYPDRPKVVFQCLSDPNRRARFVVYEKGDQADAQQAVIEATDDRLRSLLDGSRELD